MAIIKAGRALQSPMMIEGAELLRSLPIPLAFGHFAAGSTIPIPSSDVASNTALSGLILTAWYTTAWSALDQDILAWLTPGSPRRRTSKEPRDNAVS